MLFLLGLFVALALLAFATRSHGLPALTAIERGFIWAALLPTLTAFVAPALLVMFGSAPSHSHSWRSLLTQVGLASSVLLFVAGIVLVVRRRSRGDRSDVRLAVGLLLAGLPVGLAVLGSALYLLAGWVAS